MDPRLKHPFTGIIAGPTGSGKSYFVKELISNAHVMIEPPPQKIIWHYGEWQTLYERMDNVEFVEGLPDLKNIDPTFRHLIIIDDLMAEADKRISNLFTKGSHHRNVSVLHLMQNLFDRNKESRTMSLNAHYMVLFKNPRDASQITHLAKQIYPGHIKYVQEAYTDATSRPYGYLFLDLKQDTPEYGRVRTNIMPSETQFVYLKKT